MRLGGLHLSVWTRDLAARGRRARRARVLDLRFDVVRDERRRRCVWPFGV